MFSFFRKGKSVDLMAFLKESKAELARGPAYTQAKQPVQGANSGIEVLEAQGGLAPELEEAAVLYANGKIGETARRAGIETRSLFDKMKRYGLKKENFRPVSRE
mgnify:CR=1 FL=1